MNRTKSRDGTFMLMVTILGLVSQSSLVIGYFYEEAFENLGLEKSPITQISVLTGSKAILPCDVASKKPNDKPLLVLFYKDSVRTPIYSLDARGGPLSLGTKWIDITVFDSRVDFNLESSNPGLVIDPVRPRDNALYRCRVDFKASPTRNARIQLEVIVPPKRISITNDAGLEVSGVIGPYSLGASVSLTCNVDGGHPLSKISWRKRSNIPYEISKTISSKNQATTSILVIKNLTRVDLYALYTCQAVNSNLISPMKTSVTLDLTFPPLEVFLSGIEEPLTEGKTVKVVCEVLGSRPAANVSWWKNGFRMDNVSNEAFENGNLTRSAMYFVPEIVDNGAHLVCRAKNPVLPMAVIESSAKIEVLYSPRLKLFAGHGLNMEDIKDGDDVYFECEINANPKTDGVWWYHNGVKLSHNTTAGMIQSNQSLVLQKVRRQFSGDFGCVASNSQGSGTSNTVQLSVKFAPHCRKLTKGAFGVEKNEAIKVTCEVNANPEPKQYRWAFNTSSELLDLSWMKGETEKVIEYSPRSDLDYGSLLCWAENEIGTQQAPCVFHIIHSSIPEAVRNCAVFNVTFSSAVVFCEPGWGGGHDQSFTLQIIQGAKTLPEGSHAKISYVRDSSASMMGRNDGGYPVGSSSAQKNIWDALRPSNNEEDADEGGQGMDSSTDGAPIPLAKASPAPNPHFMLTGLEGGTEYLFSVFSVNRKGMSRPVQIRIDTPGDSAEKRVSQGNDRVPSTPDVAVVILTCSASAFVVTVIFLVVVVKLRKAPMVAKRSQLKLAMVTDEDDEPPETICEARDVTDDNSQSHDERTPDVIPSTGSKMIVPQIRQCPTCKQIQELVPSSGTPGSNYSVEVIPSPSTIQRNKRGVFGATSPSANLGSFDSTSGFSGSVASPSSIAFGGRCTCNYPSVPEGRYFESPVAPEGGRQNLGFTSLALSPSSQECDPTRQMYDSTRAALEPSSNIFEPHSPSLYDGGEDLSRTKFNSLSRLSRFGSPAMSRQPEDNLSSTLDKRFLKGGTNLVEKNLYRNRDSTSFIIEGFLNSNEVESSV